MPRSMTSRIATLGVLAAIVLAASFAFGPMVQRKLLGKTPPGVAELRSMEQLRADFNQDAGSSRLILIFSPT